MALRTTIIAVALGISLVFSEVSGAEGFKARDLQGIQLGMTPAEVEALVHARLVPLGGEQFKLAFNRTNFDLEFTPAGHLYRIDSDQELGNFFPNRAFASELTKKLSEKFGPPASNELPLGPMSWGVMRMITNNFGTNPREVEGLSVMLEGGWGGEPVHLLMKMMDFRVLWRDEEKVNSAPRDKAAAEAHY